MCNWIVPIERTNQIHNITKCTHTHSLTHVHFWCQSNRLQLWRWGSELCVHRFNSNRNNTIKQSWAILTTFRLLLRKTFQRFRSSFSNYSMETKTESSQNDKWKQNIIENEKKTTKQNNLKTRCGIEGFAVFVLFHSINFAVHTQTHKSRDWDRENAFEPKKRSNRIFFGLHLLRLFIILLFKNKLKLSELGTTTKRLCFENASQSLVIRRVDAMYFVAYILVLPEQITSH